MHSNFCYVKPKKFHVKIFLWGLMIIYQHEHLTHECIHAQKFPDYGIEIILNV